MVTFLQASTSSVWIHGRNKGLYKGRSQRDKNRTRTPTCLDYILDYTYIVETRDIIVTLLLILPLLLSFFFFYSRKISPYLSESLSLTAKIVAVSLNIDRPRWFLLSLTFSFSIRRFLPLMEVKRVEVVRTESPVWCKSKKLIKIRSCVCRKVRL